MIRLRRFAAFLLMTVWLTATQHCALEAAGVWETHDEASHSCCGGEKHDCSTDACDLVEGGSVAAASTAIKIPAPAVSADLSVFVALAAENCVVAAPEPGAFRNFERTRSWVPARHFTRRAAPPTRAPDESAA